MEIDQAKEEEQDSDEAPAATPDPSDDETDEESVAPTIRAKSSETLRAKSVGKASQEEPPSEGRPPPKRDLPFGRPATRGKKPEKQPSPEVDDEDTEDEEL